MHSAICCHSLYRNQSPTQHTHSHHRARNLAVGIGNVNLLIATEKIVCEYKKSSFTFDSRSHFHITDGYTVHEIDKTVNHEMLITLIFNFLG